MLRMIGQNTFIQGPTILDNRDTSSVRMTVAAKGNSQGTNEKNLRGRGRLTLAKKK